MGHAVAGGLGHGLTGGGHSLGSGYGYGHLSGGYGHGYGGYGHYAGYGGLGHGYGGLGYGGLGHGYGGFGHGYGGYGHDSYGFGGFGHGYGYGGFGYGGYSYYPFFGGYGSYYPYYGYGGFGGYGSYAPYYDSSSYTYAPVYIDPADDDDVLDYNEADGDANEALERLPALEEPYDWQRIERLPGGDRDVPSVPDDLVVPRFLIEPDEPPEALPPLPEVNSHKSSNAQERVADSQGVRRSEPRSSPDDPFPSRNLIGSA